LVKESGNALRNFQDGWRGVWHASFFA
jgi:hypothetical protein